MHSYVHYPPLTNVEAYKDAMPPTLTNSSTLSDYSDACWGLQIGSAVDDGTLLPLFKFRRMNGGIVFTNGDPLGWLGEWQDRTSLSSCEAEICATNFTSKKIIDFCNLRWSISKSGHSLSNIDSPTLLFNNNDACVRWLHNMTSKAAWHIELRENSICEWVHDKILDVLHVAGKLNPADIFTKEMRNGTHFCHLRDSFMSRLSDFLSTSLLLVHHARLWTPNQILPAAACVTLTNCGSSYFTALATSSFCRTLTNTSHLCSSGCQLLRGLHGFVPSCLV